MPVLLLAKKKKKESNGCVIAYISFIHDQGHDRR
jgi:hypothetical protein